MVLRGKMKSAFQSLRGRTQQHQRGVVELHKPFTYISHTCRVLLLEGYHIVSLSDSSAISPSLWPAGVSLVAERERAESLVGCLVRVTSVILLID